MKYVLGILCQMFLRHIDQKFATDKVPAQKHRIGHRRTVSDRQFDIIQSVEQFYFCYKNMAYLRLAKGTLHDPLPMYQKSKSRMVINTATDITMSIFFKYFELV